MTVNWHEITDYKNSPELLTLIHAKLQRKARALRARMDNRIIVAGRGIPSNMNNDNEFHRMDAQLSEVYRALSCVDTYLDTAAKA